MTMNKKMLAGMMLAGAAMFAPAAASAQVAGLATVNKIQAVMGAKAFKDGYTSVNTQRGADIAKLQQLQTDIDALVKPLDTNGDHQLTEADADFVKALQQRDVVVKSLDANKDEKLTGTELEQFRAKNLPVQQYIEKQQEASEIERSIQVSQLYVVNEVNKQYETALQSIATTKKLSAVFPPGVVEWAPKEINITTQVIAAIDRALPTITVPAVEQLQFTTSQDAVELQQQIEQVMLNNAVAAARAAQAKQQQQGGAAPAQGQPPATQPQPAPGDQPDSR